MASVTQRIKQIKQPYGGYLRRRMFSTVDLTPYGGVFTQALHPHENLHGSIIGLAVDYLTRLELGVPVEDAFHVPLVGSIYVGQHDRAAAMLDLMSTIEDDDTIVGACLLVRYDTVVRAGVASFRGVNDVDIPDAATIENIRTLTRRVVQFYSKHMFGPITSDGFTFEGGYTETVDSGDGDFLTSDTLWDLKVMRSEINKDHTLQILMYYLMGVESLHPEFQSITKLGALNPRLNKAYLLDVGDIPAEILTQVKEEVLVWDGGTPEQSIIQPLKPDWFTELLHKANTQ